MIDRAELIRRLNGTIAEAKETWRSRTATELLSHHTIQGFSVSETEALIHTSSHFVGHTHQIIMLTRQALGENYRFHWTPDKGRDDVPI